MKLYGDVSDHDRNLAQELTELEQQLEDLAKTMDPNLFAKGLVCLAHDWHKLGMEEKSEALLSRAETTRPGYFKEVLPVQMSADPRFDFVVKSLSSDIMFMLLNLIGDKKNV